MSDKAREDFEKEFVRPTRIVWSENLEAYVWDSHRNTLAACYDDMWQAWLAAKEKYEPKTVEPFHVVLEPSDIEMILYQANMHLLPQEEGDEACAVGLQIGWSLGNDGEKQFGLNVYCFEYPEEGVIPLVEMEPPSTQRGGE